MPACGEAESGKSEYRDTDGSWPGASGSDGGWLGAAGSDTGEAPAAVLTEWYRRDDEDGCYDEPWNEEFDPDCSPPEDEKTG